MQAVLHKVPRCNVEWGNVDENTERGIKGFGSSDKKGK